MTDEPTDPAGPRGVDQHRNEFARFYAPFRNAEITLIDLPSDDVPLMELRIREGRRITTVQLDKKTVAGLAKALGSWPDDVNNETS